MPQRSNDFQKLVYAIHTQLAGKGRVEESEFLTDSRTGEPREVDVVIHDEIGPHPIVVSVECRDHKRSRQGPGWVEEMWAKHQDLPTNSLILVSASGFTPSALAKASSHGVAALTFEEATAVEWPSVIDSIQVRIHEHWFIPLRCTVVLAGDDGWRPKGLLQTSLAQSLLVDSENVSTGTLQDLVDQAVKQGKPGLVAEVEKRMEDVAAIGQDVVGTVRLVIRPKTKPSYLLYEDGGRHPFGGIVLTAELGLAVVEPSWDRKTFAKVPIAIATRSAPRAEMLYTLVEETPGSPSFALTVAKMTNPPLGGCTWDVALQSANTSQDEQLLAEGLKGIDFNDPDQGRTSSGPPRVPNVTTQTIKLIPSGGSFSWRLDR